MISIGLTTPNERSWGKVLQTAAAAGMEAEGGASEGFTLLQELKRVVRKSNMVMSFHDFGNLVLGLLVCGGFVVFSLAIFCFQMKRKVF